jgi:type IV secretory pathway TraG/TraD family ATPase VirD4
MRGWTILVLVVVGAWFLILGPPAVLEPVVGAVPHSLYDLIGWFYFTVFPYPGKWVLLHIWGGFFSLTLAGFFHGNAGWWAILVAAFAWSFAFVFSYFFWLILFSRFWKLIGRWNPFGWKTHRMRPTFLRMYANVSDWWERETKFGRQATGGFASLLSVLSNEFKHGDIFLGRPKLIVGGMLRPIGIQTEKHMVTIAGTGSGKSTGALIPNLCIHRGSALIIDPKGELATITARRRGHGGGGVRGIGQDVFVLDPFGIVPGFGTASYNVFDEMERVAEYDVDRPVSYARKVAQALVPSTSRDPYWDDAPRTFISGLLLYIFQGPEEQRNLVRLRELIMEGDVDAYGTLTKAGGDPRGDAFDALLAMMKSCPEGPYRHVIVGSANSLSKMSPNQRGSVLTMAMEHTSFLDMPEIRRISMSSDFLLEDLKNRAISIYLCLPLNAVSGIEGRWLRMFVLLTVDMMTRVSKAPNPPLLLAIDEFPSLGKLDGIETVAPTMRSVGVRLWVIGQDLEQFERVYPESWGGFIGNAEAVQFMGITHPPTVAWLAERLGQHVVVDYQKVGKEIRENRSERALREPDQVARMLAKDSKNQIIWRGAKRPMTLKICPYFEYMPWWYYSRDPRFREKFNRWIWRGGADIGSYPKSPRPPDDGPPKPPKKPPRKAPKQVERPVKKEEISSYFPDKVPDSLNILPGGKPSLESYVPQDVKPSDNVPGTKATWGDAIKNFMERIEERLPEPQPKLTVEEVLKKQDFLKYLNPKPGETPPAKPPERAPEKAPEKPAPQKLVNNPPRPERPPAPPKPPQPERPAVKPPGGGAPSAPPAPVTKSIAETLAELDALIGLEEVKAQVRKTVNLIGLGKAREKAGLPHLDLTHHLVFTGNPGTGKTTVARIVGRIYKDIGLLEKGHLVEAERADLVAEYVGQTAPKTKEVIDRAMDGVLFIDEAYSLAPINIPNDFGTEVIATLIKSMEDNRNRLVVIVAGYKEEMERMINLNPGLKSRFKTFIDFKDYSPADLFKILAHMAGQAGVRFSVDAMTAASALMESLDAGKKGFGNGRTVRNIFEEILARQAGRLAGGGRKVDVTMFEKEDIPAKEDIAKFA